jgi:hypothetical protein
MAVGQAETQLSVVVPTEEEETSWNPLGYTGPVTGLLYLLLQLR